MDKKLVIVMEVDKDSVTYTVNNPNKHDVLLHELPPVKLKKGKLYGT